jgi:hypothetical protein
MRREQFGESPVASAFEDQMKSMERSGELPEELACEHRMVDL